MFDKLAELIFPVALVGVALVVILTVTRFFEKSPRYMVTCLAGGNVAQFETDKPKVTGSQIEFTVNGKKLNLVNLPCMIDEVARKNERN